MKKSRSLTEEKNMRIQELSCSSRHCSAHVRNWSSSSVSGAHEGILNILNISPRMHHPNHIVYQERRLCDHSSLQSHEVPSRRSSTISIASNESPNTAELVKEIAALDTEIFHLERYLLSLYRTSFDQCQTRSPSISHDGLVQDSTSWKTYHEAAVIGSNQDMSKAVTGTHCPDDLGASQKVNELKHPCKLSEEIIRCISSIYKQLSDLPKSQLNIIDSPFSSSASSSSTLSPCHFDCWSPQHKQEAVASFRQFELMKDKHGPHSDTVEVTQLHLDDLRFDYTGKMLNTFSSLVRYLKLIDPRKLSHGEQVAFWINIHNALVMHAFLDCRLHQGTMKSISFVLKAAYNVGGHAVNAYVIQSSIFGCQPHRSASWLSMRFSPAMKTRIWNSKHPYVLTHPEPLAHFALSSGAYSDPAVRVYTAKGIFQELQLARDEFIQANVEVKTEKNKIILPKILHYYRKDTSLKMSELLEMVGKCMPEAEKKAIRQCLEGRPDKCYAWLPYNSGFRYLLHRDLVT